ncbi:alkaline phosphatase family protein, partial [bacterium]|nr:alkaline phosphatase family protein [bacterium]
MKDSSRHLLRLAGTTTVFLTALPAVAHAYIGPGAGFVFVSSFFILLLTFFLALIALLTWPIRWIIRSFRGRRALAKARVRQVVILGLDGLDPDLAEKWMDEGLLPNLAGLRKQGTFSRLRTTFPAMSPVAWSSFQTGCNPGRHRIFDFLKPNRKNYLPEDSSARIETVSRTLSLGPIRIPLRRPSLQLLRKSRPFWHTLGEHGIFSTVLRVPITFPPEKFRGVSLSAMTVPDLKGTQGSFTYYTSDPEEQARFTGGYSLPLELRDGQVDTWIAGPADPNSADGEMRIPIRIKPNETGATLILGKSRHALPLREYTPWISVAFRKARGIVRFYLKSVTPHLRLYMSPVNIDPARPPP